MFNGREDSLGNDLLLPFINTGRRRGEKLASKYCPIVLAASQMANPI
jgi:hypothetical protein